MLKGNRPMGLRAKESQSWIGSGFGTSGCRGRRWRTSRSRTSSALLGGEGARLESRAVRMRSFSLATMSRSLSSCAISARRESRSFCLSASGCGALRPRLSAGVGVGASTCAAAACKSALLGPFLRRSGGRSASFLSGDDPFCFSDSARFRLRRRDGVLCIPDGGVLTTGSGCSGVGGSSGSGAAISGSTPRATPGCTRADIALSSSSSSSGAGGGSGRGVGRDGVPAAGPNRLGGERKTPS